MTYNGFVSFLVTDISRFFPTTAHKFKSAIEIPENFKLWADYCYSVYYHFQVPHYSHHLRKKDWMKK